MSKTKEKAAKAGREFDKEYRLLLIFLIFVFSLLAFTSFVKIPSFWGINYLYHLPFPIKIIFICAGAAVFLPGINRFVFKIYQRIAETIKAFQLKTDRWHHRLLYLFLLALVFGGIFYFARVFSIYHGTMASIFILERKYTSLIDNFIYNWEMKNRILLILGYIPAVKYLFYTTLHYSAYWSLAIASIIVGVIFVLLLDYFITKLRLNPFHAFFIFVLIFTQAISYNFFGVANLYTPVPVSTLLFLLFTYLYFNDSLSIVYPILTGIAALLFHLGNAFILPSMMFLVLHRFRDKITIFYNLLIFQPVLRSVMITLALIFIPVIIIQFNFFTIHSALPDNIVQLSQMILLSDVFTFQNIVCFFNKVLISSPAGIILFIVLLRYIRKEDKFGEFNYFLLWMAIGGLLHHLFMVRLDFYDWDSSAWASTGYVLVGGLLYLHCFGKSRSFAYLSTIILTHSLIYFSGWIVVNTNMHSAVNTFLEYHTPEKDPAAVSTTLKVISVQNSDSLKTSILLKELENNVITTDDYLLLTKNYFDLHDNINGLRMLELTKTLLLEKINAEPDNYHHYYAYLETIPKFEKQNPENRKEIEPYFRKLIQLRPTPQYFAWYATYLQDLDDYQKADSLLKKADLLFLENPEIEFLGISQKQIKLQLSLVNYFTKDDIETIRYFKEALALGTDRNESHYASYFNAYVAAYYALGNFVKVRSLLQYAQKNTINITTKEQDIVQSDEIKNRAANEVLLRKYLINKEWKNYELLLTYSTEDNVEHSFNIYKSILHLRENKYQELINLSNAIIKQNIDKIYVHNFLGLGYLGIKSYDSALQSFMQEFEISSHSTNAVWLVPYTMLLLNNYRQADEWISKLTVESSLPKIQAKRLKFVTLLSRILQKDNIQTPKVFLDETEIKSTSPEEKVFLPQLEEIFRISSRSESTKYEILMMAKSIGLTRTGFAEDFISNASGIEQDRINALAALKGKDYIRFFDYLGPKTSPVHRRLSAIINLENVIGRSIFNHAQQFIIKEQSDSLAIYGRKMIMTIPSHFQGYVLMGIYYKNLKNYTASDSLFDMALVRVKNSKVLDDTESGYRRIQMIKSDK